MKKIGLALMMSAQVFAGNGSSGGAHIYGDQVNPWFLQNTKEVSYCVEIDSHFSKLSQVEVENSVEEAFEIWRRTFSHPSWSTLDSIQLNPRAKVGGQIFKKVGCTEDVDLTFYMGGLPLNYLEKLPDLQQTIGLAYRSSYNPKTMKAQGFIYISPENGPLRPRSKRLASEAWSFGSHNLLLFTLVHELGHVFGLADRATNSGSVMDRHFVERILDARGDIYKSADEGLERYRKLPIPLHSAMGFYSKTVTAYGSDFSPLTGEFFQLDTSNRTIGFSGSGEVIEVFQTSSTGSQTIGQIKLSDSIESLWGSYTDLVSLWIPREQEVFKSVDENYLEWTIGLLSAPSSVVFKDSIYTSATGETRVLDVNLAAPFHFRLSGEYKGKKYDDLILSVGTPMGPVSKPTTQESAFFNFSKYDK